MAIFKFLTKYVGIDLGTANTLVFIKGKGIVVDEPSVVAIDKKNGRILAVGTEAKNMIGKAPDNIELIRPLKEGVVADFDTTYRMIEYFLNKSIPHRNLFSHVRVVIGVPSEATTVEKRAVIEATLLAKAKDVMIIEEPIAAAIGAGLSIEEAFGHLIVDIGGGTTEIAVISLGGIVVSKSLKIAGDTIDVAIMEYIKKKYQLSIGVSAAETIKKTIGTIYDMEELEMEVTGRDLVMGLPKKVTINSNEIYKATEEILIRISDGVKNILEITHPELSADIMVQGMTLTGGGALLRGIEMFFSDKLGIPVKKVDEPLKSVALGAGISLNHFDVLKKEMNKIGR
ncbi:MAG: rod shape-determining protein [Clostridiales bacterium]|nr:rod shape-determining protein [Clostridiales bacterium]